ncbi:TonB-dependent receptor [Portibacter lacus]|uniref:TonB-dependent receptor n=1 Tax=Portibacter lacus TaxID=1099794 RepID=A0AA37STH0_9BACT|nr:TonB-dependent receptor [Portibacter lacus]GLR19817.1 TonB-dependent receptor [Portibacter lacus]
MTLTANVYGQEKGALSGKIIDQNSQEALAFSTIGIPKLGIGTTSDIDGFYRLLNIPYGDHEVIIEYVAYETKSVTITIDSADNVYNVGLFESGIEMEQVVVTAQALGQRAAINRQINSNTIVNVVSKQKLQELPDQNAAESVGRLAGVSVYRDAGEGQQVSIRGISPRFNNITVNGERLPSTDQETRAVDLSMISTDALEGIEVFKATRPDMDGDAIGGTVNFTIRKADPYWKSSLRILGGYNDLKSDFGQFRGSGSVGNRFFKDKLGIILAGNYQKVNRSNEFLSSTYENLGEDPNTGEPIIQVSSLNLGDRIEKRERYGGVTTIDYKFSEDHKIVFSGSLSKLIRNDEQYRRRFRVADNEQRFTARTRQRNTNVTTSNLSGTHLFGSLEMTWRGSYSRSIQREPYSLQAQFWELAATTGDFVDRNDLTTVPSIFKNRLEQTTLRDMSLESDFVDEKRKSFQIDFKQNLVRNSKYNAYLKFGGKYRDVSRGRDANAHFMRTYLNGDENPAKANPGLFLTRAGNQILLANFLGDYQNGNFYNGQYDLLPGTPDLRNSLTTPLDNVNVDEFNALFGTNYGAGDGLPYTGHIDIDKVVSFYEAFRAKHSMVNGVVDLTDYDGKEAIYAGYLMSEFNYNDWFMLMGGVRYERTDQSYTSRTGSPREEGDGGTGLIEITDVTAAQGYGELLPMGHMRIKLKKWFDVRAAVTKTLARPNFFNLVPWESINNAEQTIQRGKPDLKHTTAINYDLFLSFYDKFGLFTIGGFYKELDNIDYLKTIAIVEPGNIYNGYLLTEPSNVEGTSTVFGTELDLQVNFRSLKGFMNGFLLGANLTLAKSNTYYPLFEVNTSFIPQPPFFVTTLIDTFRTGPIVGQADLITNLTLGYEKSGFSGRISAVYQSRALSPGSSDVGGTSSGVGRIPELDFYDDGFWRFDVALKQKLSKKIPLTLIANINNLSNTPERTLLGTRSLLTDEEYFGFTVDFGILYTFVNQ